MLLLAVTAGVCGCRKDKHLDNPPRAIIPRVDAGPDIYIIPPMNSVEVSGRATDADGTIVRYAWRYLGGPMGFSIDNYTSPKTRIQGLVEGDYMFELTVTDNDGLEGSDNIRIFVGDPANDKCPACWDY